MSPAPTTPRYPGLDLLRALAILLVLVSHAGGFGLIWAGRKVPLAVMMCGFLGVELFFALSGFLIGGLLLDLIRRDPTPRGWARFMARRWLRTLPLYLLWLAVLLLAWRPSAGMEAAYLLRFGTLTQNLFWPMPPDHWFAVSWSLAVEEWFYFLFSAALIGAVALTDRPRVALWGVVALFILAPVALRLGVPTTANWDTGLRKVALLRLDAIAYGVAMAALWRDRHRLLTRPLPLLALGLALIGLVWSQATFWPDEHLPWLRTFSLTLTPLGFALCLPASMRIGRLPGAGIIQRIAAWSYALYLVHFTVLEAVGALRARVPLPAPWAVLLAVLGFVTLAAWLHRWVERPILLRRPAQYAPRRAARMA